MDFAKEQLSKHGWTEGQGLGKTESGITEAIKVKIKQNKTGVGHDPGEEFSFHWWDHVFNKAASNIKVKTTENGVEIKNKADTLVTKKKNTKTYCNKNMLYGQFVKGATLSDGTETKDELNAESSEDEEQAETTQCLMPDQAETVFKMCGGRTAHKGARHGLKLNGKLQRIEEQEKQLLESYKSSKKISVDDTSGGDKILNNDTSEVDTVIKKKTKKEKKRKRKLENEIGDVEEEPNVGKDLLVVNNEHVETVKSKKKKKSKKNQDIEAVNGDMTNLVNDVHISELTRENSIVSSSDKKKKKSKKRKRDIE